MEKALVKVDGYKSMEADVAAQKVTVKYDAARTNPQKLAEAINAGTNFQASAPKG